MIHYFVGIGLLNGLDVSICSWMMYFIPEDILRVPHPWSNIWGKNTFLFQFDNSEVIKYYMKAVFHA